MKVVGDGASQNCCCFYPYCASPIDLLTLCRRFPNLHFPVFEKKHFFKVELICQLAFEWFQRNWFLKIDLTKIIQSHFLFLRLKSHKVDLGEKLQCEEHKFQSQWKNCWLVKGSEFENWIWNLLVLKLTLSIICFLLCIILIDIFKLLCVK